MNFILLEDRETAVNVEKIESISMKKSNYTGKYLVVLFIKDGTYIYATREEKGEAKETFKNLLRVLQNVKGGEK